MPVAPAPLRRDVQPPAPMDIVASTTAKHDTSYGTVPIFGRAGLRPSLAAAKVDSVRSCSTAERPDGAKLGAATNRPLTSQTKRTPTIEASPIVHNAAGGDAASANRPSANAPTTRVP